MLLPAAAIALQLMAIVMRMTRTMMLEVLRQDYVRTARAKGASERMVVYRHALRNALIPVVSVIGFQVGGLMGGSAIVEVIFGLNGVGNTLVQAIFNRDYPLIQAAALFLATIFVVVNLGGRRAVRLPRPAGQAGVAWQREDRRAGAGHRDEVGTRRVSAGRAGCRAAAQQRGLGAARRAGSRANGAIRSGMVGAAIVLVTILLARRWRRLVSPYEPSSQGIGRLRRPERRAPDGHRRAWPRRRSRGSSTARGCRSRSGAVSVVLALVVGSVVGMLAGFYGGRLDDWLMRVVDIMFAVPGAGAGDRDRRAARPEPHQRDDRDRDRLRAGLRAGDRGSVLSVMAEAYIEAARVVGRVRSADHAAPHAAEHPGADHRDDHGLPVDGDPDRGGVELPGARARSRPSRPGAAC